MRILDKQSAQEILTVLKNILFWSTKTFQDHSEIRYIFQFGSEEFLCRWEQNRRQIVESFQKKNVANLSFFISTFQWHVNAKRKLNVFKSMS